MGHMTFMRIVEAQYLEIPPYPMSARTASMRQLRYPIHPSLAQTDHRIVYHGRWATAIVRFLSLQRARGNGRSRNSRPRPRERSIYNFCSERLGLSCYLTMQIWTVPLPALRPSYLTWIIAVPVTSTLPQRSWLPVSVNVPWSVVCIGSGK